MLLGIHLCARFVRDRQPLSLVNDAHIFDVPRPFSKENVYTPAAQAHYVFPRACTDDLMISKDKGWVQDDAKP